jgi:hypothetical protein
MGSTMIVSGPHSSGKTHFILDMIQHAQQMFDVPPVEVFWCFGHRTAQHETMVNRGFTMIHGLPANYDFITPNSLIMLDDLMSESANNNDVTELFTAAAHHVPCFVIKTCQNLFPKGKDAKTHSLNANYMVLFKNPRDVLQIGILERQMFPSSKQFLVQAFRSATHNAHDYLFMDLHKNTPEHVRIRARVLPHQRPMVAYVDKRLYGGITTSKFLKTPHVTNPNLLKSFEYNNDATRQELVLKKYDEEEGEDDSTATM